MSKKTPDELPVDPFWPAPDQRAAQGAPPWPRPLSKHEREAVRYRSRKVVDKPIPKGWRHSDNDTRITLTNGRELWVNLLPMAWGMLDRAPQQWVDHDRLHRDGPGGPDWMGANDTRLYILNPSWWPGVSVCSGCWWHRDGEHGERRNPYVTGERPEGYVSLSDEVRERRFGALQQQDRAGAAVLAFRHSREDAR